MKKYLIISLLHLFCFTDYLIAQDLNGLKEMNDNIQRSKQIKEYFLNKSPVDYLHNGFFMNQEQRFLKN